MKKLDKNQENKLITLQKNYDYHNSIKMLGHVSIMKDNTIEMLFGKFKKER